MLNRKSKTTIRDEVSESFLTTDKCALIGRRKRAAGLVKPSQSMLLEDRIMLDGAGAVFSVDVADSILDSGTAANNTDAGDHEKHAPAPLNTSSPQSHVRHEIAFVDTTIEGYQKLLVDLVGENTEVYWQKDPASGLQAMVSDDGERVVTVYSVDGSVEGFDGITKILESVENLDAIHVLSHGEEAGIRFGTELMNQSINNSRI